MEKYQNIENNTSNMYNVYIITTLIIIVVRQNQTEQIAYQLGIKIEKSQLANSKVLKNTSGNIAKLLKMRQKTYLKTKIGKILKAVIKQIAAQKLQAKKKRIQRWKQIIKQEIGHKLQAIRQAYKKAIKM